MKLQKHQTVVSVILIAALLLIAGYSMTACLASPTKTKFLEIQLPYPTAEIGSWGFIDKHGKYVIAPHYNSGGSFKDSFATVSCGQDTFHNHYIHIDKQGKEIAKTTTGFVPKPPFTRHLPNGNTEFTWCREFSEGLAVETVEISKPVPSKIGTGYSIEKVGECLIRLVNNSGGTVAELHGALETQQFSEGLLAVRINDHVGYIDKKGKLVIKDQFDRAFSFHDGLASVVKRSNIGQICGYIDKTGTLVIPYTYEVPSDFHDERALVKVAQGKTGYIDKTGKMIIPLDDYSLHNKFSDGIATFSGKSGSGLIDKEGKIICRVDCRRIGSFSDGLCAVRTATGVGFIDKSGKWALPPKYRFASDFSEGLAAVCEFDDKKLKQQQDEIAAFKDGELQKNPVDGPVGVSFDGVPVEGHRN